MFYLLQAVFLVNMLFKQSVSAGTPSAQPTAAFLASCSRYQETEAEVEAIFTDGDGLDTQRMFITNLVTVHSTAPDVASILGRNKIIGNEIGTSEISVDLPNSKDIIVTSDTVTVSNSPVNIVDLQVSAITGATNGPSDPLDLYDSGRLSFDLHQNLTYDGMTAGISVFANFSDGTWADVTSLSSILSLSDQLTTSDDSYGPKLTVNDYAHSEAGGLIEARFPACYLDEPVVGRGVVKMDIEPVRVFLTPEFSSLAAPGDLAAQTPFSLPLETLAAVSILFKDGNVRNFTDAFLPGLNPRAVIEVAVGSELLEVVDGNLLRVLPGAKNGTVELTVRFPGVYEVTGTAVVHVAGYVRTETVFVPYPFNPGILKTTVFKLDCSGKRQRLSVVALATLSNGDVVDVSPNATFHLNESFSDVGYLSTIANGTVIFVGTAPGTAYVRSVVGLEELSEWTPIRVVDELTSIVRLDLTGHAPNDTLRGYSGSEWDFLSLTAFFDDGTYYSEILRGLTTEWVQAHELVEFGSTNSHAVSVSQLGVLTQHYNYYAEIFISATQHRHCHDQESANFSEILVFSNLEPRTLDFDMGSMIGPKFGTVDVNEPMHIPVRVQAFHDKPVTAFHIILQFDSDVVAVDDDSGCVGNPAWTGFFECTTNNPPGEVIIAGVCGIGGCVAEDLIHFANVRFHPKSPGQSYVTGHIIRVEDSTHCVSLQTVFAGADDVHVELDNSGLSLSPSGQTTSGPFVTPHPTQIPTSYSGNETMVPGVFTLACPAPANCHSCVMGDVNSDCVFDAGDARALEQLITLGKVGTEELSSCQRTAMDPNRDGLVDYLDVVFLLRVMTKKYRFLTHLDVAYGLTSGLAIGADIRGPTGGMVNNASTSVSFSLATNQASELVITVGERVSTAVPALVQVNSVFNVVTKQMEMVADHIAQEVDFAIAVTVRTRDDLGRSGPKRVFTYYCSPFMDSSGVCVHSLTGSSFDGYFAFDLNPFIPSAQPSSAPTAAIHGETIVALVHPIISSLDGPALPIIDYPQLTALSQWSMPFDTLIGAAPGASSTVGLTITGRQYASATFTVPLRPATVVVGVVKTPLLYGDSRTLSVAYQLTDDEGHTQVASTALLMAVNSSLHSLSATFACLSPDPASGIGSCSGDVSATWFDATEERSISVQVLAPGAASGLMPVQLERLVATAIPPTVAPPFMLLSVPLSPVIPGETFTVDLVADTGIKSLHSWSVSLSFDFAVLEFVSQQVGGSYSAAVAAVSAPGTVDISCPGTSSVGDVINSGQSVDVMTVTLRVLPGVNAGLREGILSMFVYHMTDEITTPFLQNTYAFVQDYRDFNSFLSADMIVAASEVLGVFAYAPQNEMVNTATIDGVDLFSNIHVVGVTNSLLTISTVVTSDSECIVRSNATTGMDVVTNGGQKCVVKLSSHKTSGFSKGVVDVDYNEFSASVPFRIWQPQTIKVKLTDAILNSIEPIA